jgi:ATP-binding cassette subfamily F protein 3
VLAADLERAELLHESETSHDPDRLGEIHERLNAIDAHAAPAVPRASWLASASTRRRSIGRWRAFRAAGGCAWRWRACCSRSRTCCCSTSLRTISDLEAVLWLEDFLKSYPATILIVSHERDFLNNVVDYILHLERGKLFLYPGGYDSFERQRAERQAQIASARQKQQAQREHLQAYIAKNSARASTAKQAQSRQKALAKMQPIAELLDDPSLSFDFPSPEELRPPLITLDMASVGYGDTPVLSRLNLRIDPDDRIALLGRNGNGKTTLARLLAAQLKPMDGAMNASGKMRVGYFTQYQVEELDRDDTPLEHMTRLMKGASQSAVRAQLGRFGFQAKKATTKVGKLSGGERARLALALITRDAPHMLILDEPTNHLDVDAREALIQALNAYNGAVLIVSHDRHMLEMTADRLVLVDGGTAKDFDGSARRLYRLRAEQGRADAGKRRQGKTRRNARRARRRSARAGRRAEASGPRMPRRLWPSSPNSAAQWIGRCSIPRPRRRPHQADR